MRRCSLLDATREETSNQSQAEFRNNELEVESDNAVCLRQIAASRQPSLVEEDGIGVERPHFLEKTATMPNTSKNANSVDPSSSPEHEPHQTISVQAMIHIQPSTPVKIIQFPVPSPFKRALSWPEPREKPVKSQNREIITSVVSSAEYKNYLQGKRDKKLEKKEKKKERAIERARKKEENEKKKFQKAEETAMKKAMAQAKKKAIAQAKKKQGRTKKFRKVTRDSSCEEEEDEQEEWVPQDESEKSSEEEDVVKQCALEAETMELEHSLILPDSVALGVEEMIIDEMADNHHLVPVGNRPDDNIIEETRLNILESSSEEQIIIPLPFPIDNQREEEQIMKKGDDHMEKDERIYREPTVGDKDGSMSDEDRMKNGETLTEDSTLQKGDYVTAFMCTKKKRIRVACCVLNTEDGHVETNLLTACNRMKNVFTIMEGVKIIERNSIISRLPKPLGVFANRRILFPEPLEVD